MTAPAFVPIDWRRIRDTLWQWFAEVSGCETIWADQAAPQPAYPYASLNILPGTTEDGALDEERIQDDGSLLITGPRDFVLSCQIHVNEETAKNPNCGARARAEAVKASLGTPMFQADFQAANVGVRERGPIQMIDLVVGAEWVNRAQVDIRFGTTSNVDISVWPDLAKVGWFDTVSVSSEITPLAGAGGLNLTDLLIGAQE